MAMVLLLTTLALTYSRGGLIVLVAAAALTIALGPERLRLGAALAAGVAGSVPPVLTVFLSDEPDHRRPERGRPHGRWAWCWR